MQPTTIQIFNQKGGVAKTTTSVNLAAGIARERPSARVLLCECDPQGSVKTYFRLKNHEATFAGYLIDDLPLNKDLTHHAVGIDILCASKRLADADSRMNAFPRREETLKFRMKSLTDWDFVIFDCAPALNLVTQNVFNVADFLVIPSTMDPFAVASIHNVLSQLEVMKKYYDKFPQILGVLPTIYDKRLSVSVSTLAAVKEQFDLTVFEPIGIDSLVKRAQVKATSVFEFESRAAKQYELFVKTVISKVEHQ